MSSIDTFKALAAPRGLTLHKVNKLDGASAQYRIKGGVETVDWWPNSRNQTAYVARTNTTFYHLLPDQLIKLARTSHPTGPRKRSSKPFRSSRRVRQYKANRYRDTETVPCFWCKAALTRDDATVDHMIPLSRGGKDRATNFVIACQPCNQDRGNDMPPTEEIEI